MGRLKIWDELFHTPTDVARKLGCHSNTVRQMADGVLFDLVRTKGGMRVFSDDQVELLARELNRRLSTAGLKRGSCLAKEGRGGL